MSHTTPGVKSKTDLNLKDYWRTSDLAYADACFLCGVDSFDIDAAADSVNSKCSIHMSEGFNSLGGGCDWFYPCDIGSIWCNPPFSKKIEFLSKAYLEVQPYDDTVRGLICMMIPYAPCTKWFREHVHNKATFVYVPDGRYNFLHPETGEEIEGVNFSSCFAVFTGMYINESVYVHYERGISQK